MFLAQTEIEPVLNQVKAAFPNLSEWEYSNEKDGDHYGFTVWGCLIVQTGAESWEQRRFYVTFDIFVEPGAKPAQWHGTLTVGQHSYMWTSADFGDAHLVNTAPCATLAEAISALKTGIADLASAFSAL
ncbi:MAG: hypothetical protein HYR56_31820 [Acidobacteria bacterium]|nr:hypothetical protein [Acidobacteriota bacterium]MBI3424282.1 hypothetical protein [Acidobacteriota bacterium]